jgi:LuxR family maltose regulon positive regulatory protein
VTAPPGSGKVRLIEQWLAGRPDRRWTWIDVDRADAGLVVAIVADALRPGVPGSGVPGSGMPGSDVPELDVSGSDVPESDVSGSDVPGPSKVLILAGIEVLTPQEVSDVVDAVPPGVRLVLIGSGQGLRADVLVALAGELVEIQADDLFWSEPSIADRVEALTGDRPSSAASRVTYRLTGGWPAGVIMLARHLDEVVDEPVVNLAQVPQILDFVSGAVLDRLPDQLRRFVLQTCVAAELDVELCAALTPGLNPYLLLAELERHGLLASQWPSPVSPVSPVSAANALGNGYHPVVAAAARRMLRRESPRTEAQLLRISGEFAYRQGDHLAATTRFLEAGEWMAALDALRASARLGFRGWQPRSLAGVLDLLPAQVWAHDPESRIVVAFAAVMGGDQLRAAEVIYQTPVSVSRSVSWWPALARTVLAFGPSVTPSGSYQMALSALEELAASSAADEPDLPRLFGAVGSRSITAVAHLLAARAALFDADHTRVRRHLDAAWSVEDVEIPRYCLVLGLGTDALDCVRAGELSAAGRRAARAERLAEEAGLAGHSVLALAVLAQAELLRARGRSEEALMGLEAAADQLHSGEPFVAAASGGRPHGEAERILRAQLRLDLADVDAARAELEVLATVRDDRPPVALAAAAALAQAAVCELDDDVTAAEQTLLAAPSTAAIAAARIALALRRQATPTALEILENWPSNGTLDNRLSRLLAVAGIALARDRRQEATERIDEALVAAEPDGHLRVFLAAPATVRAMTSAMLRRASAGSAWRRELAEHLDELKMLTGVGTVAITPRELAVLEQLTTSLTHAQIATGLFVSENTLKSHCRNLYRKLGVSTRSDAVRVARARGWLAASPLGDIVLDVNITREHVVVDL